MKSLYKGSFLFEEILSFKQLLEYFQLKKDLPLQMEFTVS